MFEKIIESLFVKKKEYKINRVTVLRKNKYLKNDDYFDLNLKRVNDEKTCLSEYFALRKGLNVYERNFYKEGKITARNRL